MHTVSLREEERRREGEKEPSPETEMKHMHFLHPQGFLKALATTH